MSVELAYEGTTRRLSFALCSVDHLRIHQYFDVRDPEPVAEATHLLESVAAGFAAACRSNPSHATDAHRRPELRLGRRGVDVAEAEAFLRTFRAGAVDVRPDGSFSFPRCRTCPPELHLVGRGDDATVLHTEYLVQIGSVTELVEDHGWSLGALAFEQGEWDVLGYDGDRVSLAVEAKARAFRPAGDSLESLRDSLLALSRDSEYVAPSNHRRKWHALDVFTASGPVEILLVASGARWWLDAERDGGGRLRVGAR